jgi:deazaflavin-dependent oxidoreductase (nitroreductase family)
MTDTTNASSDPGAAAEIRAASPYTERLGNPFVRSAGGGRVLSALMLPDFTLAPPRGFGVLTTTGRRTGKPRRKCIRAIRSGKNNAVAGWLWNIRANPSVTLRIRGGTFKGVARELDEHEAQQAREAYCDAVHAFDYAMCPFHRGGRPTRAKIQHMTGHWFDTGTPLVVELATA